MAENKPNVEAFLDLLKRSGLVEKARYSSFVEALPAEKRNEVDAVADLAVAAGLITRWQSSNLLKGRHRGFFLGKYKLLDMLGSGGMSTVYLAEHTLMQRQVAIKILPKNRVQDSSYLARFHREAQAAAALDHRNIVRAYDVDNEGGTHYLVMEFVRGRDLQRIVADQGPLDYAIAAGYIRQAAEGLAYAHEHGLIHRDIKPANLLVDEKDVVKILDLGLARFADDNSQAALTLVHDENVLGTADYLAPEQARDSHGVDSRADIYSLGCSLYFVLTGHPPFCEGTMPQRLMGHLKLQPPSIHNDRPDAPHDLVEICAHMMAKKPDERYSTAGEVAEVLGAWLAAHKDDARAGGSSGRLIAVAPKQARSAAGGSNVTGRSGGGTRRTGGSGARRETVAPGADTNVAAESDTLAGLSSKKGAGSSVRPGGSSAKKLRIARPLDAPPDMEFLRQLQAGPLHPASESPAARRPQTQGVPVWLWLAISGGALLALLLMGITGWVVMHGG